MLSKELETALNEHLDAELFASHLYLAMAAYCESIRLPGAAHWMQLQSEEERGHALRFYQFINDRGGRIMVGSLDAPPTDFGSLTGVFQAALEHERGVSERIQSLYRLTTDEGDYATQSFLQWFVNEQVEEEKAAKDILDQLDLAGDDKAALLLVDRDLGERTAAE